MNKDHEHQLDLDEIRAVAQCVCANFRMVSRVITQHYDEVLRPAGVTSTQFPMLALLAVMGATTVNPLAETLMMDRTTLTRNLKPLVEMGVVEIGAGKDDRRTKVIRLTEAGQTVLRAAFPLWQQAQTDLLGRIGNQRWLTLLGDIKDVAAQVTEA